MHTSPRRRAQRLLPLLLLLAAAWPPSAGADTLTSGWITLSGTWQTPFYKRETGVPGPVVMITGGVHGNELAGAAAANQIRTWPITRGTLVVIPFAAPQALAAGTREMPVEGNLNRNFPGVGDPITATTGSTATALWAFTRQVMPEWLIDMHEGIGIASDEASNSVGSSIIHMNEKTTNTQVTRMLAAVNATISDPTLKFTDLGSSGPIDTSLARATVTFLGTRGMIAETTSTGQLLSLRVNQHRTAVSQFLMDQGMIVGAFGGPRNGMIDEFTFDEPAGSRLTDAGNSYPNGGVWNTSPFDTRIEGGVLRIQRATTGTSTTSTGLLGGGEVRVRRAGEVDNLPTDIGEGFATMVVDGWDFRGTQIGETISFGFRNLVSSTSEDTALLVLKRTGANEVSLSGTGFGTGSGSIAPQVLFPALQQTPVQFVMQLNKQLNLDGSALVSGSASGGFYRIFAQTLGQDYREVGSGAAVRQDRNGNNLVLKISGSVGASGGFFDVERMAFSSALPGLLIPDAAPGSVNLLCTSGTLTQGRAGFPVISGTLRVEKNGAGTMVLDGTNTYTGVTSIAQGILALSSTAAIAASSQVSLAAGAALDTRSLAGGYTFTSGQSLVGSGTVLGSVTFGRGSTLSPGSAGTAASLVLLSAGDPATFSAGDQFGSLQAFAVPEPTSSALLGLGLGLVGLGAARRRRAA